MFSYHAEINQDAVDRFVVSFTNLTYGLHLESPQEEALFEAIDCPVEVIACIFKQGKSLP